MSTTKTDARQIVSRQVLGRLLGINGTQLDTLLASINKQFNAPVRMFASTPADALINFESAQIEAADLAATEVSPISSQIPTFVASTVNFQTGATTGGTFNITFPVSTVGFFRRVGFTLDASGTMQVIFTAEAATIGAVANAGSVFLKGGLPVGWIDLECTQASPARFKTAASATNIIEHKTSGISRVHRIMGGGGSGGSGTGSGIGDDLGSLRFKASFRDEFNDLPSDTASAVDYTAAKTDAATYDIVNGYHRIAYDATKTVTGTGTAMTMSAAPTFTVKAGDVLRVGAQARRITVVTTQTAYTLEAGFDTNPSAASATVSQAIYSKDLNNFSVDGLPVSNVFNTPIDRFLLTYDDTETVNDIIQDNATPHISYQASVDNINFTNVLVKTSPLNSSSSAVAIAVPGNSLYFRFAANKTTGSGFVNLLGYRAFFHKDETFKDGGIVNQALVYSDASRTPISASQPVVASGRTRVQLAWSYPVGVGSGTANGALEIYINGQKIPRFVSGSTPDAYYTELNANLIELDTDYSSLAYPIEIIQKVSVIDQSETNTTAITQMQEATGVGFQGFIAQPLMIPTTVTGAPALGTFHSTVINRKPITDFRNDLKPRMGIDRLTVQQVAEIQDEFGPNGEKVFRAVNDTGDSIRFVGSGWTNIIGIDGQPIATATVGDFAEITFYGTGLNILLYNDSGVRDHRVSVDGGVEGSNIYPASGSPIISQRNYSQNKILNVFSNLSLGIHTVKIRHASGSNMNIYGFEALNESVNVLTVPGTAYIQNKKTIAPTSSLVNYATSVTGTRGGRIVTFLNQDGTTGRVFRAVGAQANLSATDHTNEEVVRKYNFREFAAGRADDFSLNGAGAISRAFTLDDNTTTLILTGPNNIVTTGYAGIDGASAFISFTFVGTGLDIVRDSNNTGLTGVNTVSVDGVSIGTYGTSWTPFRTQKIVSGLPYGTHIVTFATSTGGAAYFGISDFTVYQPKKPTLPAGVIELSDYNVMANFVANTTSGVDRIATGVLRKICTRELVYSGTWNGVPALNPVNFPGGFEVASTAIGSYVEYTFFGTGFELRGAANTGQSNSNSLNINGLGATVANYPTLVVNQYGTGWTYSTNIISQVSALALGSGLSISGLPLGRYTVRMTANSASSMVFETIDIITPIHSAKSNVSHALQNTLTIGNQGISDNRALSPVKSTSIEPKNISQAFPYLAAPTTTSTAYIPIQDMHVSHLSKTGRIKVSYSICVNNTTIGAATLTSPFINGAAFQAEIGSAACLASALTAVSFSFVANVPIGANSIGIYWRVTSGTAGVASGAQSRVLTVEDV